MEAGNYRRELESNLYFSDLDWQPMLCAERQHARHKWKLGLGCFLVGVCLFVWFLFFLVGVYIFIILNVKIRRCSWNLVYVGIKGWVQQFPNKGLVAFTTVSYIRLFAWQCFFTFPNSTWTKLWKSLVSSCPCESWGLSGLQKLIGGHVLLRVFCVAVALGRSMLLEAQIKK